MDTIEDEDRRGGAGGAARAFERVKRELQAEFGSDVYRSYIQNLQLVAEEEGVLVLLAETRTAQDWLNLHAKDRMEARFAPYIRLDGGLAILVAQELSPALQEIVRERRAESELELEAALAPSPEPDFPGYTFDTFCDDPSNNRALTIMRVIASGAGRTFPLVLLHSAPGCGKTHLVHATAHAARCADPSRKVRVMMAQEFIEEFQLALHKKRDSSEFKQSVREPDLLLIDDVHRIAGRKVTEEEFIDTIAILNARGRQVVLTANQGPDGIAGFDDRLRHHLSAATVCEIQEPDENLRLRILETRVQYYASITPGFRVARDALEMMARKIVGTGRLLDGAVSQLLLEARINGLKEVTLEAAENALKDKIQERADKPIKVATVLKVVARHNNMSVEQLLTRSRQRAFARPRQIAAYLCTQLTHASLPDIGRRFGRPTEKGQEKGFDHSTILYSRDKIKKLLESDPKLRVEVDMLARAIRKEPS
ncbi:MAG: AAA family ATPase [Hyphomonadaceae bacterium]|nr:AAA family ATPase [Hyphomonadaceae bacterium]